MARVRGAGKGGRVAPGLAGLAGDCKGAVTRYVDDWIVSIRDATALMIQIRDLAAAGRLSEARHLLPAEHPYPADPQLASVIGMAS